jgi:hypothetical protein
LPEIVPESFENKWIKNMPNEVYHGDKTAISSTSLRQILVSPYNFIYQWRKDQLEDLKAPPAKHFRLGHALHMALLEPHVFQKLYVVEPIFVGKTKKGLPSENCDDSRRMRAEWRASIDPRSICLTENELNELHEMINSVLSHEYACRLLKNGVPEISGFYRDPVTGIKCRIRPDFFNFELNALLDVKTAKSCYKKGFQRSIMDYRYDVQIAMYAHGIQQINNQSSEHNVFIAIQNSAPFEVAVYEADATILEYGYEKYRKSMDKLLTCLQSDEWPRYQKGIEPISLPPWALTNNGDGELINE